MFRIPENEAKRLRALYECRILDTQPESPFDELTRLAAQLCDSPYAMIAFVDQNRQWFKATYNFHAQEFPRQGSLSEYAILETDFFQIPDTLQDERFRDHPCVVGEPNIRFYAAAPIALKPGLNVGLITVMDQRSRSLEPSQVEGFKSLAQLVCHFLVARKNGLALNDSLRLQSEGERKIAYLSQLATLAGMVGGVAHEISNPLTIIQLTVSALRRNLPPHSEGTSQVSDQLRRLESAAERIHKITRSLVTYARDARRDEPVFTTLKSVIDDTLPFCLDRLEKENISLQLDGFDPHLGIVCRPVEISQVLLNLIQNACDAVQPLPERWIRLSVDQKRDQLEVRVIDSGSGIPMSLRSSIFRPFFTTKKVHCGTGLGLGICRSLIENHGGQLFLDEISPNTCFVLRLPIRQREG